MVHMDGSVGEEDAGTATLELELDLRERLRIDPQALQDEFVACPANIAYLGARHGCALRDHLRAKIRSKKTRALLAVQWRQDILDTNGKVTDAQVEQAVDRDPRWVDVAHAEVDAEVAAVTTKTDVAAMLAKKDMLVQLGATDRAEMERDPVVRRDRADSRRTREG